MPEPQRISELSNTVPLPSGNVLSFSIKYRNCAVCHMLMPSYFGSTFLLRTWCDT